jgi:hypothetical protein
MAATPLSYARWARETVWAEEAAAATNIHL